MVPPKFEDLLINLNANNENIIAMINIGDVIPTYEKYDWMISTYSTDEQIISLKNYPDKFRGKASIAGDYLIVVTAYESA